MSSYLTRKITPKNITLTLVFFGLLWLAYGVIINFLFNSDDAAKIGDAYGAFNALFGSLATLAVGVAIFLQQEQLRMQKEELELQRREMKLQREEMRRSSEASKDIAEDNKANAIVDLYQQYATEYFYNTSRAAWRVLANCVQHKEYAEYVVNCFFVTEYEIDRFKEHLVPLLRNTYSSEKYPELADVERIENDDRPRLYDFLNFLNVLALRRGPIEIFERCDFFYDWWRPLLWWITDLRYEAYESDPVKQRYCMPLKWKEMLIRLDEIYGFETPPTSQKRWKEFINHPMIQKMRIDPNHECPKAA